MERSFLVEWLFSFALVLLARLPYLLSNHVYFDGDEAVLGIMARDLINGNGIPIYFYGQQYGFSLFEVFSAAIFIPFLGSGLASLKLGGMLLFSLGIQRLLRVLRKKQLPLISFLLLSLILVTFPTWQVWGTKLRGGYITAFVGLTLVVEQLILSDQWNRKNWMAVSIISAVIFVSQPIFLLVLIPLLIQRAFKMNRKDFILTLATGLIVLVLLRLPAYQNTISWKPPGLGSLNLDTISSYFFKGFWSHFTGYFSYSDIYEIPVLVKTGAMIFFGFMCMILGYSIFKGPTSYRKSLLLLLIGASLSAISAVIFGIAGGRYFIPFYTGWMIILVVIAVQHGSLMRIRTQVVILALLLISLVPTTTGYDRYVSFWLAPEVNDMAAITELKTTLEDRGIKNAFVSEWQVFWQLNYLGNEDMNFRHFLMEDRVQRFVDGVNSCYLDEDCPIALTGSLWPLYDMQNVAGWDTRIERVNDRFYLMENPEDIFLEVGKFELPESVPDQLSGLNK
ncbi:MAG: hypothetical protein K9J17_14500 [Flavobacteriales bacterium]|nr:hypothetical protein [Flavobacteriales bacterium]